MLNDSDFNNSLHYPVIIISDTNTLVVTFQVVKLADMSSNVPGSTRPLRDYRDALLMSPN